MSRRILSVISALAVLLGAPVARADVPFFVNSYAIVVGINTYLHSKWPRLSYAVKDAEGVAAFLRTQGFEVIELYEKRATREAIISAIEDHLAPKLAAQDRVLFFFAGHGIARTLGEEQRGYLVPYDGTEFFASLLAMNQLHDLSDVMSMARHQLFILDACFGGLISRRGSTVDPRTPRYIDEITKRRARQVLTAGGANQRVMDGGPEGHSLFTGQLLKALKEGMADGNGDGYTTFSELSSYIQVAASKYNQTPGVNELNGHEQGEFVFINPMHKQTSHSGQHTHEGSTGRFRSEEVNVYELLKSGKQAFAQSDYGAAVNSFKQAAEHGNAEAMTFLGKLHWEGWGVARDGDQALRLFRAAAERGDILAMRILVDVYGTFLSPYMNLPEKERWSATVAEAEKLAQSITLVDPSGGADRGEPKIPDQDIRPTLPAPTNFRIISR